MDKNAIKKYAVWAREELIKRVSTKAEEYGVSQKGIAENSAVSAHGRPLSGLEQTQRKRLVERVRREGYDQVMEEAAYTWFNRFIALRFMEVNNYLPSRVRVFTNEKNEFRPQIMAEALHLELDGLDVDRVIALKQANDNDALYKYLLITQCNALSAVLPRMFQKIEDDTELLFPDNVLREGSVIEQMISCIPEEDWTDQVQIIGWLYQYYNTEPKAKVFARPSGQKIKKEEIPAATQLFTPDWIVRYMVENSLGRLWVEGHSNDGLKANWKYYLEEAEQEPEVQARLEDIRAGYKNLKPEDIKVIDPCMGSGHILVYAFDALVQIYESYGYSARDAVRSILEHNLYGLDIDNRAAQLAYFSVMMTAVKHDGRFLRRSDNPQPCVYAIAESNGISGQVADGFTDGQPDLKKAVSSILAEMRDAKEYGSLLQITPVDFDALYHRFDAIMDGVSIYKEQILTELLPVVHCAEMLAQKYDVVVTNPPYMGGSGMNNKLAEYVKKEFPDSKGDLFSCFIEQGNRLTSHNSYNCMVTMQSWMFLSSFEKMRIKTLQIYDIISLMHMENMVMGIAFGTAVTVFRNNHVSGYKGTYNYVKLEDIKNDKPKIFPVPENRFAQISTDNFSKIPGSPVAYWWKNFGIFDLNTISDYYESAGRNKTHNNELYVRNWWEIADTARWQSYANGGVFRRWAGNDFDVVDWSDTAKAFYAIHGGLYNQKYNGKRGICWNLITSYKNGFRLKHEQHHYSSGAPTIISTNENHDLLVLAYLNSTVATALLNIYNPTLNTTVGDVLGLPISFERENEIVKIAKSNIMLSQSDWDAFETSWDFTRHPLVRGVGTVAEAYAAWDAECTARFQQLKATEEELNRIFIDIYGLQDELTPEVEDRDVTVRRADLGRDIRSLISYAVGCMFGRYSLDMEGLAYAGGEWDTSRYATFPPDQDGILPICDDDYFEDDIMGRFVRWVETVYGRETLEENLSFIAGALGGRGSPREVIRSYFLNGFYADHCKIYQKRPIYWLFDSGKKGGFKALIYLHRYQPDTIARIRTDYVHEQQARYRTAIADLERRMAGADTAGRVKLGRAAARLREQDAELHSYEEKIHHLADQMIQLDLDDGVKANYAKFQDVLAKIK